MSQFEMLRTFAAFAIAAMAQIAAASAPQLVPPSDSIGGCNVVPSIPPVPSSAKTFKRSSSEDDTASIQAALDKLKPGDWLVFPPDTYAITKHLAISVPNITVYAKGATFKATNPTDGAVIIDADNISLYGLTYTQNSTTRQSTPWSGGISVYQTNPKTAPRIRGATIQGNTIQNSAAAGIFVFRADGFTIANNTVSRSLADGIHITAGSTLGRVIGNKVTQTGDDMIAVVSYTGNRSSEAASVRYSDWSNIQSMLARNIYIAGNEVSDNYWGRGISVVGGEAVTIENNSISRVPAAAGIYLERETSFMTLGDHNILVRGNTMSDIETREPTYKPANINLRPTHHGAIEIGSQQLEDEKSNPTYREALSISQVAITDNELKSWGYAPIRIGAGSGMVSDIQVLRNKLSNSHNSNLIDAESGLQRDTVHCAENVLDGKNMGPECASGLSSAKNPELPTGAKLACTADGGLRLGSFPREPTNVAVH